MPLVFPAHIRADFFDKIGLGEALLANCYQPKIVVPDRHPPREAIAASFRRLEFALADGAVRNPAGFDRPVEYQPAWMCEHRCAAHDFDRDRSALTHLCRLSPVAALSLARPVLSAALGGF